MTLELPDELMTNANLTKKDLLIEIACIVFKHGSVSAGVAAKIAGISKMDFYGELKTRQINWIGSETMMQSEFDDIKSHPLHDSNK